MLGCLCLNKDMKIIMVVATSKDGFIASEQYPDPTAWTSQEDKDFLRRLVQKNSLMVFGKNTYKIYGKILTPDKLRVVLCTDPQRYKKDEVEGQLEFTNLSPQAFYDYYSQTYSSCLLLGGAYVYRSFYDAGLINDIFVTVEPIIFGGGKQPFGDKSIVELAGVPQKPEVLNQQGTSLQHYVVNNNKT